MGIIQINAEFHGKFLTKPMVAFKCSKNLHEVLEVTYPIKKNLQRQNEKCMLSTYSEYTNFLSQLTI